MPSTDSTQQQVMTLQGEEKLTFYAKICMKTTAENNIQKQLRVFEAYRQEANRQNNAKHEVNARTQRLYALYNYGWTDSLQLYLDDDLQFMATHQQWTSYYSCWSLRVERLLYDKKLQSALNEAREMYKDAQERKQDNGLGISAYLIASSYQSMGRNEEACNFFLQAEKQLRKEDNEGQLHNVYGMAWQAFAATKRYDEQLAMADRWEKMWETYRRKEELTSGSLAPYLIVCHLSRAHAQMQKGKLEAARSNLDKAEACAKGTRDISRLLLYREEALYAELNSQYQRALELLDKRQILLESLGNRLTSIENSQLRARLLLKLGRSNEAALLYEQLLPLKDSINSSTQSAQLNELNSIYQVDRYKFESRTHRLQFIFATCGCLLLLTLIVLLYYHHRIVNRKNTALIARIRKQQATEAEIKATKITRPVEALNSDELLFQQIELLLEDKEVLSLPNLGRNELPARVFSNRTSVGNAIRNCTDDHYTVSEYINRKRAKYACELLEYHPDLSIEAIGEMCGFSRSNFYSSFKNIYDVSPGDFRKAVLNSLRLTKNK